MQGFNMGRYVPPDVEGTTSGNKLHGKHALGSRASKLRTHGALTVRFEMPFGVWCGTCAQPTLIGQGVRFNAEKRRVGHYHSTPVYSFRMRHADCGGAIEIRTDPQNTAYVVAAGGKRRDTGEGGGDGGDHDDNSGTAAAEPILTDRERERLRADAFSRLEKTIADRAALAGSRHRIDALEDASSRRWEDPYARNRLLRDAFRAGRRRRDGEARSAGELAERLGLGFEILPGTDEDARRAALVDFGGAPEGAAGKDEALVRPLFGDAKGGEQKRKPSAVVPGSGADKTKTKTKTKGNSKRLKSEIAASQARENLVSELVGNTRASQDPFLVLPSPSSDRDAPPPPPPPPSSSRAISTSRKLGIRRKRKQPDDGNDDGDDDDALAGGEKGEEAEPTPQKKGAAAPATAAPTPTPSLPCAALVEYDSD